MYRIKKFTVMLLIVAVGTIGTLTTVAQTTQKQLPPPDFGVVPSNHARVIGWPADRKPLAPPGFKVEIFANGFENSRWLYVLPNGDVLVSEANQPPKPEDKADPERLRQFIEAGIRGPSPDRIILLRDIDNDGIPDLRSTFIAGLNQPFGMALVGNSFFVANTDGIMRYSYATGATKIESAGTKIYDMPEQGYNNHWTRNLLASADGKKLYVTMGSGTNVDEEKIDELEPRRAAITEINIDGTGARIFAGGLRNPNGLAFEPTTGTLWAAVNERDYIGDNSVDDYVTSVKDGGFYGWPYAYYGPNQELRKLGERPDLVEKTIPFDIPLGAHAACMDIDFYTGIMFPSVYQGGAFVSQRGSWNRTEPSGFKVLYVPFNNGKQSGPPRDFLTGFLEQAHDKQINGRPSAYGRPVGITVLPDGSLLVADDGGDCIWRISYTGSKDAALPTTAVIPPTNRQPLQLSANAASRHIILDAKSGLRNPESAFYYAATDSWYVSNVNSGTGPEKALLDNNGFISRITGDGKVETLKFIEGGKKGVTLQAPRGLVILKDKIWVADLDHVRSFDIKTGAVRDNIDIRPLGAKFLNDIAVGPDGVLYVTDMGMITDSEGVLRHAGPDRIFRVDPKGKKASIAYTFDPTNIQQPNGITYDVANGRFLLVSMSTKTKGLYVWKPNEQKNDTPLLSIGMGPGEHDGLLVLPDGRVIVSSHATRSLNIIHKGDELAEPIAVGLPTPGDIGFDVRRRRIAIPIVGNNRLEFWDLPTKGKSDGSSATGQTR
ncbi:MAG: PQQ-dependent sugar dehydrogenase [Verrucomicrobia bacterium]|nr:PQQ-dependent sugar dehydrogenase [Cytophagales bacterium]